MIPVAINDVPVSCINIAAITYHIPATLIISVLQKENARNGSAIKNKNGTFDYGPFQINSVWLKEIARFGITKEDIQYNPCINAKVGSWILAKSLAQSHTLWSGIGNYHSHTPQYNQSYRNSIHTTYQRLNNILKSTKP